MLNYKKYYTERQFIAFHFLCKKYIINEKIKSQHYLNKNTKENLN